MTSTEKIIEVKNLSKNFGDFTAVNQLNFSVMKGDVFGFLGPNGAGKSTTIRMLLTLVKPTGGEIFIFNESLVQNRKFILGKVGCIVEKPDFYKFLSAEKNLDLFSQMHGSSVSKNKIYETLELVGLKGREKDKVKTYSHGMKQRLGLAQTLIHNPELIILDEPTTGLDPQGIIDIRNLINHLRIDLGKTILLSSHILSEIELIATRMVIINKGKAIAEGNVEELLHTEEMIVSFSVNDANVAVKKINESSFRKNFLRAVNEQLIFQLSKNEIALLNNFLVNAGEQIFAIESKRKLEDVFLKLVSEN